MAIDRDLLIEFDRESPPIGALYNANKHTLEAGLCELLDIPYDPERIEDSDRVPADTLRAIALAIGRERTLDETAADVQVNQFNSAIADFAPRAESE